jgi:hypothetical protein
LILNYWKKLYLQMLWVRGPLHASFRKVCHLSKIFTKTSCVISSASCLFWQYCNARLNTKFLYWL